MKKLDSQCKMCKRIKSKRIDRVLAVSLLLAISILLFTGCSKKGKPDGEDIISPTPPPITGELTPNPTEEVTPTESPTIEVTQTPTPTQEPTQTPIPTPEPTQTPDTSITPTKTPTQKPDETDDDFGLPKTTTNRYKESNSVIREGDYLFYKEGNLLESYIMARNLKTSKVKKLAPFNSVTFSPNTLFYKDGYIYFNERGTIYRVDTNGQKDREEIIKGDTILLGFKGEHLFYYNKKNKEITSIDSDGKANSRKVLAKFGGSGYYKEIAMNKDGIYYIEMGDNFLADANPMDTIYYLNIDTGKSEALLESYDIYDLKVEENNVYFAEIPEEKDRFTIYKGSKNNLTELVELYKEDFDEKEFASFGNQNAMTLLTVGGGIVYYGLDDFNNKNVDVYSVHTDGSNHGHMFNIYTLKDINREAYFSRFQYDEGYLIMHFDCDEAPHETFVLDISSLAYKKLDPGHYSNRTIDIEGDSIYYAKNPEFDHYNEMIENYEFKHMKLKEFLKGSTTIK